MFTNLILIVAVVLIQRRHRLWTEWVGGNALQYIYIWYSNISQGKTPDSSHTGMSPELRATCGSGSILKVKQKYRFGLVHLQEKLLICQKAKFHFAISFSLHWTAYRSRALHRIFAFHMSIQIFRLLTLNVVVITWKKKKKSPKTIYI